jgi:hypothetical protein
MKHQAQNRHVSIQRLEFLETDFDILDAVLKEFPELRICVGVVKAVRAKGLKYPIKSPEILVRLLPKKKLAIEGHALRADLIERYMPKGFFPINNERDLIVRCYLALMRCKDDMSWAARAPAYGMSLLKEFQQLAEPKRKDRNV